MGPSFERTVPRGLRARRTGRSRGRRTAALVALGAAAGAALACGTNSALMGPETLLGPNLMRSAPQSSSDALFGNEVLPMGAPPLALSAPPRARPAARPPAAAASPPIHLAKSPTARWTIEPEPQTPSWPGAPANESTAKGPEPEREPARAPEPKRAARPPQPPIPPVVARGTHPDLSRPDPSDPPTPPPLPATIPAGADRACLRVLRSARIPYVTIGPVPGIRTPVHIIGRIRGIELSPRAGRPAVMDCEMARALTHLAPVFRELGITTLSFSGAYDYRTRRGSQRLSAHAFGLAIDVHHVESGAGRLDVKRDYPRNALRWKTAEGAPRGLATCLGNPGREEGRILRSLACQLKLHPSVRVLLTPDDNADHRDHLHIETFPGPPPGDLVSRAPARRTVR